MRSHLSLISLTALSLLQSCRGQTFQRLGACPKFGCILPPDQYAVAWPRSRHSTDKVNRADFLPGQRFDIRLEVHAPVNGSEVTANRTPDPNFTFVIAKTGSRAQNATQFFALPEPRLESWNFTWFEGQTCPPSILKAPTNRTRSLCRGRWDTVPCQGGRQSISERGPQRAGRVYCYFDLLQWLDDRSKLVGPRHTFHQESEKSGAVYWRWHDHEHDYW